MKIERQKVNPREITHSEAVNTMVLIIIIQQGKSCNSVTEGKNLELED